MLSLQVRLLPLAAALFLAAPLAAHAADNLCGLLTNAEIAQATSDPVLHSGGMAKDCIWSGDKSRVYISTRDSATWAGGKAQLQQYGANLQPVSGVGEDAFFWGPAASPTLYAKKGAQFILLRVNVKGFSQGQTEAALKTLANDALAKM